MKTAPRKLTAASKNDQGGSRFMAQKKDPRSGISSDVSWRMMSKTARTSSQKQFKWRPSLDERDQ